MPRGSTFRILHTDSPARMSQGNARPVSNGTAVAAELAVGGVPSDESRSVLQLLAELAQNPVLMDAFFDNSEAVLDATSLDEREKNILKSGRKKQIDSLFSNGPCGI